MSDPVQNLEIHLHKVNGSVEKFIQSETGLVQHILNAFQPAQIFGREQIIIAGGNSLTSFSSRQVVRIDLISELSTQRMLPLEMVEAVELTGTEFHALLQNPELGDRWDQARAQDTSMVAFLNVELAGQQPLFLALEVQMEMADRPEGILASLAMPALCFRMRNGGIAILNLAHLVRFTFFPGPSRPPAEAWPARQVNGTVPKPETGNFRGPTEGGQSVSPYLQRG